MTRTLMKKLREILFWNCIDSWDNNILVSVRVDYDNFELKIFKIVSILLGWYLKKYLKGQQSNNVQEVLM